MDRIQNLIMRTARGSRLALWLTIVFANLLPHTEVMGQSPSRRTELPSVIVVVTPDLSNSDIDNLAQTFPEDSGLLQMVNGGKRWTRFYSAGLDPALNQGSLLTGRHAGKAWVRGRGKNTLRLEDRTFVEDLKRVGYTSAMIGFWEMGDPTTEGAPLSQGFKEWVGFTDLEKSSAAAPESLWRNETEVVFYANSMQKKGLSAEAIYMLAAENFIRINSDLPFFLYLNYGDNSDASAEARSIRLQRLNKDIGSIIDALRKHKIHQETALLVIGGRGAPVEEPDKKAGLRYEESGLYEGNLRTPALLWWPETVEAGEVDDTPWAVWDIYPTLAELTGARAPRSISGQSALALWSKELSKSPWNSDREFYWEHHGDVFKQAILSGGEKWIRTLPEGKMELFQLESDPTESKNLWEPNDARTESWIKKSESIRTDSFYWPLPEK